MKISFLSVRFFCVKDMRFLFFISISLILGGVNAQSIDSNKHHLNGAKKNRVKVNFLKGKTVNFYLSNSKVDNNAKRFYKGEIDLKASKVLNGILDSALVCEEDVRPFYFFLFNRIIELSDGAYDDIIASRCKLYVERYPCDFFNSFNEPEQTINVVRWTTLIGSDLKDKGSFALFRGSLDSKLKASCPDVQDLLKSFMMEVRMCLVR